MGRTADDFGIVMDRETAEVLSGWTDAVSVRADAVEIIEAFARGDLTGVAARKAMLALVITAAASMAFGPAGQRAAQGIVSAVKQVAKKNDGLSDAAQKELVDIAGDASSTAKDWADTVKKNLDADTAEEVRKNLEKSGNSLKTQADKHRKKLEAYKADPDACDNLGQLKGLTQEDRERRITIRVAELEKQIKEFDEGSDAYKDIVKELGEE